MTWTHERFVIGVDDTSLALSVVDDVKGLADRLGVAVVLFHATTDRPPYKTKLRAVADDADLPLVVRHCGPDAASRASALLNYTKSTRSVPVVMSHGRRVLTAMLLGSTASEVLRRTDQLVLLHGPEHDVGRPVSRVVVCLDGTAQSEEIVADATRWADSLGVPVVAIEVFEPSTAGDPGPRTRRLVVDAVSIAGDVDCIAIEGAKPAAAIVEFVNEQPGTLTAMTTHGRHGVDRLVAGSVAADVIHGVRGPMLMMNPHFDGDRVGKE